MHDNPTGWTYTVKPEEEFTVRVDFNPLAHGPDATGPITRMIYVISTAKPDGKFIKLNPKMPIGSLAEIKLVGNVLSEKDYNNLTK